MKKLIEKLYNYFKKKYLRSSYDFKKIFLQAFIETYGTNIRLVGFFGVDCEQIQLGKESFLRYTVYVKRPCMFIGFKGKDFDKIKELLTKYTGEIIDVEIKEA